MMDVEQKLLQLLMESGYLAAGYGMTADAESIFEGLAVARPDSAYPLIGKAFTKMSLGAHEEAAEMLRDQLDVDSAEAHMARSFMGMALLLAGKADESRRVLDSVVQANLDPEAVNLAQALLQQENS